MRFGTWAPHSGTEAVAVAAVLLVVAATLALSRHPFAGPAGTEATRPCRHGLHDRGLAPVGLDALHRLASREPSRDPRVPRPDRSPSPTFPVTASAMVVAFVPILVIGARQGFHARVDFPSAVFGALAAPFVFEFPFDLIVVTRTVPEIPPDPTLFRVMYFVPLLFVAVSTIALLALSPMVRLSRSTLWALAAMFVVFALWAVTLGFAYPGSAGPLAMNVVSKILAFLATLTLSPPSTREGARGLANRRQGGSPQAGATATPV